MPRIWGLDNSEMDDRKFLHAVNHNHIDLKHEWTKYNVRNCFAFFALYQRWFSLLIL